MPAAPRPNPFKQHPLPGLLSQVLGGGSTLVKDGLNADYLLVPPPLSTDVDTNGGAVVRSLGGSVPLRNSGGVNIVANDVQIVYVAEGGREVVLAATGAGPLVPGASTTLTPAFNPILKPTDLGVFLRVSNTSEVDAFAIYNDSRRGFRYAADITALDPATNVVITNDSDFDMLIAGPLAPGFGIANFDDISHEFHIYLTDGTDTIELTNTAVPVTIAAGACLYLPLAGTGFPPALPPGWSISASLDTDAVSTIAPRIHFGYAKTNAATVRDDQAGAY